jgi:hypothetical protein
MSSIDEYSASIGAAIQAVEQARTAVGSSNSDGEELASQFEGMGAEAMGSTIRSSVEQGNEADGILVEAINKLQEMQSTAESARGNGLRDHGVALPPEPSWRNEVGRPVEPPKGGPEEPDALHQELASTDDGDSEKSRFQRFSRAFARNSEGLADQGKDSVQTGYDIADSWIDPYGSGARSETVQVEAHQPTIHADHAHMDTTDTVGSLIVMSAVVIERGSRWIKRRRG